MSDDPLVYAVYAISDSDRDVNPLMCVKTSRRDAEKAIEKLKGVLGGGTYYIFESVLRAPPIRDRSRSPKSRCSEALAELELEANAEK